VTSAPDTERSEQAEADEPAVDAPARSRRSRLRRNPAAGSRRRRFAPPGWALTAASFVLVVGVLLAPDRYGQLSWISFLRIPVEAVVVAAVTLLLPERLARAVALLCGGLVGLLGLLKVLDLGFSTVFDRPFDLVHDWGFLGNGRDYLTDLLGGLVGNTAFALTGLLLVLLVVLMALATGRLVRSMRRRRRRSGLTVAGLGALWAVLALTGTQAGPAGSAPTGAAGILADHASRVPEALNDRDAFAQDLTNDAYATAPADQLLTGLRGKDVLLIWVESYGRTAVEKQPFAAGIDQTVRTGQAELAAKGFAGRSGWLTSSTMGGGSWLAHSTLESGTWIDNKDRYKALLGSDRTTLNKLFRRAGWRGVALMPNVLRDWPEGAWYQFSTIYAFDQLGYTGPHFGWSRMPDQYTLEQLYRRELAKKGRPPVMASIELGSSHTPWAPLPPTVDWSRLGDGGSVFDGRQKEGPQTQDVWQNTGTLAQGYLRSLQYALRTTYDFVARYGTKDTVVIYLGDHQPVPLVTGANAGRDVPVTILSADPAVLDRVADWGWQPGLKPGPDAPVWAMNTFRDQFLSTFGRR
jgi:hypothetical protein